MGLSSRFRVFKVSEPVDWQFGSVQQQSAPRHGQSKSHISQATTAFVQPSCCIGPAKILEETETETPNGRVSHTSTIEISLTLSGFSTGLGMLHTDSSTLNCISALTATSHRHRGTMHAASDELNEALSLHYDYDSLDGDTSPVAQKYQWRWYPAT